MVNSRLKNFYHSGSRRLAAALNTVGTPDMRLLYGRSAQQGSQSRNPVIVIPGVLGSRLKHTPTDRVLWGGNTKAGFADEKDPEQARQVAHPIGRGVPLHELTDEVCPDGSVQRLRAGKFGFSVQVKAYENIMQTLGVGGYLDSAQRPHKHRLDYGEDVLSKCFEFDYDWRRSIPENAICFGELVEAVLRFARKESGCPEGMKVDVVAHSMGGLLIRYYLRYGKTLLPADGSERKPTWAGAEQLEHVMLIGTPNAGAINSLTSLTAGLKANIVLPSYHAAILGTMPSIYQLLPRGRHKSIVDDETGEPIEDLFDVQRWIERQWGLANPDADGTLQKLLPDVSSSAERREIALDHLAKCLDETKRLHRSLDTPADAPDGVILQLFAGDGMQTPQIARVGRRNDPLIIESTAVGDGTVLRSSALMDERVGNAWYPRLLTPIKWDNVTFIATDHMALTKHPTFVNNALYLLLEKPRPACGFRVAASPSKPMTSHEPMVS